MKKQPADLHDVRENAIRFLTADFQKNFRGAELMHSNEKVFVLLLLTSNN